MKRLIYLSVLSLALTGCLPNVNINLLLGRWQIKEITSNILIADAPALSKNKVYDAEPPLYFQFSNNNLFGTNTDLALSKLIPDLATTPITGNYYYDAINSTTVALELRFYDAEIAQNIVLYFEGKQVSDTELTLEIDKIDYQKSINNTATSYSNTATRKALQAYAQSIQNANFILKFEKI